MEAAQPGAVHWETHMEAIDAAVEAHEAWLIRMQDEADAKAAIRESEIYNAERDILLDHKLIDEAFTNHATNEEIDKIYMVLALMYQAYVTGTTTEERNGGIVDYFTLDVAPIYERVITAAAAEEVDR